MIFFFLLNISVAYINVRNKLRIYNKWYIYMPHYYVYFIKTPINSIVKFNYH